MREMKDSGIEWIGKIPSEWETRKLFGLLNSIGSGITPKGDTYYENGTIPWLNTGDLNNGYINETEKLVSVQALKEYSALRIHKAGAVVIAMYGATIGKLGIINIDLVTNQACCVMEPTNKLNRKYLYYILCSANDYFILSSYGAGQPNISQNTIKNLKIPFPNIDTQTRIADFLDDKCTKIDNYIEKQRQIIEKLKEYRRSIITEAVTKGLDKNAPMKDSGIEWIGEIPREWRIKRLKYVSTTRKEKYCGSLGELDYFGLENIVSETGEFISTENEYDLEQSQLCMKNDVAFGKLRPYLAKIFLVDKDRCCSSEFAVFSNFHGISVFFKYLFLSHGFINIIDASTYGTKMPRANIDFINNMKIPVPPIEEQQQISDYLDRKCTEIDNTINKKQAVIDKLTEYKKSLIYEAVTGKTEV